MKLKWKTALCVCMSAVMVFSSGKGAFAASEKTDGANMQKVLTYYGKKQYAKAEKACKKLSKNAHEACVSGMTAAMKKAYRKVVKKYSINPTAGGNYLWGYYLTDIDNDKKTDLLLKIGSCEADVKLYVYQYKSGKAKKIGSTGAFHTDYYAYPKHKGVVAFGGMMGDEWIRLVTIKGGKVGEKLIGSRTTEGAYLGMRCALDSHITYNADYQPVLHLDDLK